MRLAAPLALAARPRLVRGLEDRLRRSDLRAGVALVYHAVIDGPTRPERRQLTPELTAAELADHVRLVAERYAPVRAAALADAAAARRPGEPFPVALTFDDDLRSHAEVAGPILRAARVPATFFLTGAGLHGDGRFWWHWLQAAVDAGAVADSEIAAVTRSLRTLAPAQRDAAARRLADQAGAEPPEDGLRREAVEVLAGQGHEIGFHTRRHEPLVGVADGELAEHLTAGREEVAVAAGRPVSSIAYPHGEADRRVASAARAAGFRAGYTLDRRLVTADADRLLLGRLYPRPTPPGALAAQLVWHVWRAERAAA